LSVVGTLAVWAPPVEDSPERILARRFASGEIDEEEFNRRLDTLRRNPMAEHR